MAVKKTFGWRGCKEQSPIRRRPFVGDPADWKPEHNLDPSTERGLRRLAGSREPNSERGQQYQENVKARKSQGHPGK